jgi:hypothetical protein
MGDVQGLSDWLYATASSGNGDRRQVLRGWAAGVDAMASRIQVLEAQLEHERRCVELLEAIGSAVPSGVPAISDIAGIVTAIADASGVPTPPPAPQAVQHDWDELLRKVQATETLAEMRAVLQEKIDEINASNAGVPSGEVGNYG